jgi:hypothetical protein
VSWQPIKTAPPRARVLICDDAERVQIGKSTGLRWFDDAGSLLAVIPLWWMPLPRPPQIGEPANPRQRAQRTPSKASRA